MNKKDLTLVVVLILMIPTWLFIDQQFIKPLFPEPLPPAVVVEPTPAAPVVAGESPAVTPTSTPAVIATLPEVVDAVLPADQALVEAEEVSLKNTQMEVTLSNLGASVLRAKLFEFPETLEDKKQEDGQVVVLDFTETTFAALTYNMVGLNRDAGFAVTRSGDGKVTFSREVLPGLLFSREFSLGGEGYVLSVAERWSNSGEQELILPDVDLFLGAMYPREEVSQKFGPFVGIDAKHVTAPGMKHYVKDLRKAVGKTNGMFEQTIPVPLEWVGVKNKFFTQVLTLNESEWSGMASLTLRAKAGEKAAAAIGFAQPSVSLGSVKLLPGQTLDRDFSYYVGPISMANLKALGGKQEELIDFRLFKFIVPLGKVMMLGLNKLYALTHNWGVAIILLTFVVRMLFWPLTQKGAENMKRMSELSPQMKALKEKHKNNPQKLNAEMSALYKTNKVNPMAGCLPMLVQIPVFISLYGVLRVAVELRFAEFLWVKDLSEQEALFFIAGFPVNILPLTMGATMVLQQRLTPSNMDEQQKKIMMMMPIVFLFICYNMPAGLLLYWTTSNLISIYQTTHTRKRDAIKAAAGDSVPGNMKPVKNPKSSPAKSKKG
jgi:YidC/Oxa1 family membrane protein insertase